MLIGNRDTFFPDMITDLITDLSDHPIWYETLKLGQAPTSQARPRDTDHLRPSNLAARTLSLVEHTLSKFGGDPCPLRRGLAAVVKCYVRKALLFRCCWSEREQPEPCEGFNTTKGKTFFPVLRSHNCWPDDYNSIHTPAVWENEFFSQFFWCNFSWMLSALLLGPLSFYQNKIK